jgi:hypothetical protein
VIKMLLEDQIPYNTLFLKIIDTEREGEPGANTYKGPNILSPS